MKYIKYAFRGLHGKKGRLLSFIQVFYQLYLTIQNIIFIIDFSWLDPLAKF